MKRSYDGVEVKQNKRNDFKVVPISQYQLQFPFYRKPVEIGHFSLDGERIFHHDASQLKYYVPPPVGIKLDFNLRKGYDTCIEKDDDVKERLTHLLKWIIKNKHKFQVNPGAYRNKERDSKNLNTDFISWRGHFTKFLCTPYENREPWKMAATLHNGTIYISEIETEKAKNDRLNRTDRHREMCYWGFKFEDYVTKPCFGTSINKKLAKIVNTNEAFCSIVRTRLNKHSIVIGCEVDCCWEDNSEKPPANYIELKTTRAMETYRQKQNFTRYKLLKFWAQSFLAGVPKIIVGLRNDDGIVSELQSYDTINIPVECEKYNNIWEANICTNFLDSLLTWMKEVIVMDNVDTVYVFSFDCPFDKISVRMTKDGSERFLPDWFVDDVLK